MHPKDDQDHDQPQASDETAPDERAPYEAPTITKKRSLARVTLFSGGGTSSGGLTSN